MLETIHVGLTGLNAYAKGLNVISHNVSNLNTPGFKGAQLQFADLYYRQEQAGPDAGGLPQHLGMGVATAGTFLDFRQGEARHTGRELDLMVEGAGLFVLRKDGRTTYSRAGRFEFDAGGVLVDEASGARVAALDAQGELADVSIAGLRTSASEPTTRVQLSGNLSSSASQHTTDATVFGEDGSETVLTLSFENTSATMPGSWRLTVTTPDGAPAGDGELRFRAGRPEIGFDAVTLTLAPGQAQAQVVTLDFSLDVTSFAAGSESTLAVASQDGHGAGALVKAGFDAEGQLVLDYANGQSARHARLALAAFADAAALEPVGGNQYVERHGQAAELGVADEGRFGKVVGGSVEMSNVDLAQEFSEMIVTQRGYQASSQVITTANEMLQQLFEMRGRR